MRINAYVKFQVIRNSLSERGRAQFSKLHHHWKWFSKNSDFSIFDIFFIFTGGSNEVAGPPRQHLECLKGSHSEWRRSHSSAGQWERRTLSKQKGQNWNLHSVPVTRWPIASSSCKPLAARLINNTPRVVALSRNEAWREVEAVRRHVECCLSVGCQYSNKKIIEINIEESKIHRDNGPILTLASSARWSRSLAPQNHVARRGRGPVPSFKNQVYTYTEPAEKETISKPNHTISIKLCMWLESADVWRFLAPTSLFLFWLGRYDAMILFFGRFRCIFRNISTL